MKRLAIILAAWLGLTSVGSAAISYIAGAGDSTTGAVTSINWPGSSVSAGRLAVVSIHCKAYNANPDISTSGWTPILIDYANGTTAVSADTGSVQVRLWARVLDGSESGSIAFTGSPNIWKHQLTVYENATGLWSLATATASVSSRTATASTDPGLDAGDWLYVVIGMPGDNGGTPAFSSLTATGCTFDTTTTRAAGIDNAGFDNATLITETPVLTGPSSAGPVLTYTTGTTTGSAGFLRIRESSSGGSAALPQVIISQLDLQRAWQRFISHTPLAMVQ